MSSSTISVKTGAVKSVTITSNPSAVVKQIIVGRPVRRVSAGSSNLLNSLGDVDVNNLKNGSLLIYKTSTQKWTSTKDVEEGQNINGGSY